MIADTVIEQRLAGAMIWSLRFRNRDGGFKHHYEYNNYEAYRWPGFPSGDFYDERNVLTLLREKAHEIDGTTTDRLPFRCTPIARNQRCGRNFVAGIVTGAESYIVEHKTATDTVSTVVGSDVDESRYQYIPPLFR